LQGIRTQLVIGHQLTLQTIAVFIPTFLFVSITPGMCMTLAMTLGMSVGVRRALWMMAGELVGVGLVATLSAVGVASILLSNPQVFQIIKYAGGAYLAFLGWQMWRSKGQMAVSQTNESQQATRLNLVLQGFLTAVSNPKGWAFFVALLPPFLSDAVPLFGQLVVLIAAILTIEFICLLIYAAGGRGLQRLLMQNNNVKVINRIAGTLMFGVGGWLAFG
jgi:threonine/homoserine/homoserine lactone efflux protein